MTPTILSDERERILEFTRRLPSMSHWMFLLAPKPETGHMQTLLLKHWWPTHEVKTSPLSNLLLVQQGWVEMILRMIQCPCYLPWRLPGAKPTLCLTSVLSTTHSPFCHGEMIIILEEMTCSIHCQKPLCYHPFLVCPLFVCVHVSLCLSVSCLLLLYGYGSCDGQAVSGHSEGTSPA